MHKELLHKRSDDEDCESNDKCSPGFKPWAAFINSFLVVQRSSRKGYKARIKNRK